MALAKPIAINPLPWTIGSGFGPPTEEVVREALADLSGIGFTALHTDVPVELEVDAYRSLLDEYCFRPAPGYFAADFADHANLPDVIEKAKAHARQLAALGVDTTFVASTPSMSRIARPAVGEAASPEATKRSAEGLAAVAEAGFAEGVRFALHPHIGMTIETEEETRTILDLTTGSELAFGPDTGHLFWAGCVPQHIIRDYADRVAAVHLKDVDLAAMKLATRYNDDYMTATNLRHVWTEPGRGAVNFRDVLEALPVDFDGWLIVEVDVPNIPDRLESARAAYDYLATLTGESEVTA